MLYYINCYISSENNRDTKYYYLKDFYGRYPYYLRIEKFKLYHYSIVYSYRERPYIGFEI